MTSPAYNPSTAPGFDKLETSFGPMGDPTAKKVLVAYASQHGATAGVAEAIARQFGAAGVAVDLRQVGHVDSLEGYQAVVVGSAIHGGAWLSEAAAFVQEHQAALGKLPTAYFLVCMMALKQDEQNRKYVSAYLEPQRQLVRPVAEGRFGGALFPARQGFFGGLGMRIFLAVMKLKEGDHRDWEGIGAWAEETLPLLVR